MSENQTTQTIYDILLAIQTAVFGRDVRGAIHDGIEMCYNDVTASETVAEAAATAANNAATSATNAATSATTAAGAANTAATNADTARTNANNAATAAATATTNANNAKDAANSAASAANTAASNATAAIQNAAAATSYFADNYDPTKTYEVGEYSIQNGKIWRCTTRIATPEAWNSAHWAQTTIGEELNAITPAGLTTANVAETTALQYLHYSTQNSRYEVPGDLKADSVSYGSGSTNVATAIAAKQDAGKITIGGTEYTIQIGTASDAAAGYITIVLE
ncbi:MAG: hypothetical protein IJT28_08070 [Bacteroidaceae bacterium]|nr:hypothetical protein [Bacteroidaceae bacterium]